MPPEKVSYNHCFAVSQWVAGTSLQYSRPLSDPVTPHSALFGRDFVEKVRNNAATSPMASLRRKIIYSEEMETSMQRSLRASRERVTLCIALFTIAKLLVNVAAGKRERSLLTLSPRIRPIIGRHDE